MFVIKRDGRKQNVFYDKITARNEKLARDLSVDTTSLSQTVIRGLNSGMSTRDIDRFSCESAIHRSIYEPDYGILASRIALNDLHKNTPNTFNEVLDILYTNYNKIKKRPNPLISEDVYTFGKQHIDKIEKTIDYQKDYEYTYFAFKTLSNSYLQKVDNNIVERPQHMLMRVNLGIHGPSHRNGIIHEGNIDKALASYKAMSERKFTHATPTLFNAGTTRPQMSSCFLLSCPDSMGDDEYDDEQHVVDHAIEEESIPECWKHCSKISKHAGGIGVDITSVRCRGSYIGGTNGRSNGIIPLVKVFNEIGRYVDQCFEPSTVVYTSSGPKKIEDVVVGDFVITNDGTCKEVLEIKWDNVMKKLYGIRTSHSIDPVWCTSKHPFYAVKTGEMDIDEVYDRVRNNDFHPDYVEIDQLSKGDCIGFPIPMYEKDIKSISPDDCRFYGLIVSNGSYNKTFHKLHFIVSDKHTRTIQFINTYLNDKGISTHSYRQSDDSIRIECKPNHRVQISHSMIYNHDGEKIIHSNYIHLPKYKLLSLIQGLFETCEMDEQSFRYKTIHDHVSETIRYIMLRIGYLIKGKRELYDISNLTKTIVLEIPFFSQLIDLFELDTKLEQSCLEHGFFNKDNVLYTQVSDSIVSKDYNGIVIDLVVDVNHNYLTHSGLVHNGGGKRKGAISIYLEPWHPDTPEFLEIRLPTGAEELRARDVFPALWMPDLFFKRLEQDGMWSFFCPSSSPELIQLYGEEFEKRYIQLEQEQKMVRQMKASELWEKILKSLTESGLPYMLSKDSVNRKSNQKNIGTITGSNLCVEIMQVHNPKSIAVCNLASVCLPAFAKVDTSNETRTVSYDFEEFGRIVEMMTENLNLVMDKNYSPIRYCAENNLNYRPIGIGVQGLADVFSKFQLPWDSDEAKLLNRVIFETLYYHSLKQSCELAKVHGSYNGFDGSPASQGILQYDMWDTTPVTRHNRTEEYTYQWVVPKLDWDSLKEDIKTYGLRNSLLVAPMPTASTSQIMGSNESFEPYTSNIYIRKVIAGDFPVINNYLYKDLVSIGKWNKEVVDRIIKDNGSVQNLDIPQHLKDVYRTVWEISQKTVIDMAADRGAFIDQSQSMNIHLARPTPSKLSSMYLYAWKKGLKTLSYYLRSQPAVDAVKFTLMEISDPTQKIKEEMNREKQNKNGKKGEYICTDEVCIPCSG